MARRAGPQVLFQGRPPALEATVGSGAGLISDSTNGAEDRREKDGYGGLGVYNWRSRHSVGRRTVFAVRSTAALISLHS